METDRNLPADMPEGAKRGAELVVQLLDALKRQDKRISDLEALTLSQQKLITSMAAHHEEIDQQHAALVPKLDSMIASHNATSQKIDELRTIIENRGRNSPLTGVN